MSYEKCVRTVGNRPSFGWWGLQWLLGWRGWLKGQRSLQLFWVRRFGLAHLCETWMQMLRRGLVHAYGSPTSHVSVRKNGEFRTRFAQPRCCARFAQGSHKPGAVVFWRSYLPHFSSKSYTVCQERWRGRRKLFVPWMNSNFQEGSLFNTSRLPQPGA